MSAEPGVSISEQATATVTQPFAYPPPGIMMPYQSTVGQDGSVLPAPGSVLPAPGSVLPAPGMIAPVYAQATVVPPPMNPKMAIERASPRSEDFEPEESNSSGLTGWVFALSVLVVALLVATLVVSVMTHDQVKLNNDSTGTVTSMVNGHSSSAGVNSLSAEVDTLASKIQSLNDKLMASGDSECTPTHSTMKPPLGENICKEQKPDWPNVQCIQDAINEQAGGDVTLGFEGGKETDAEPITEPYYTQGMCPVNVHWHQGTEHRSEGQYDEDGKGPTDRRAGRQGFHCHHYDSSDARFTTEYNWKHCKDMKVGETYEVHWPHSAAGACGTPNQYQTPFYDGVFCMDAVVELVTSGQVPANRAIGVQAQVFTIVNDESYYYPDLFRGMIVEGDKGSDMAFYTGSTTGDGRSNEICSQYAPITWQVDRKCHLISASTFDKMCADMKSQRDDMSDDLHAHGSRELVATEFTADNMVSGDHTKSN